jgi:hypothetical protein
MTAPFGGSGGGGSSSFVVGENFAAGTRLFVGSLDQLSIPAGEEVKLPLVLSMSEYSKYYVYYIIDQDILLTVDWFNSVERGYVREKVVALAASAPDGTFLEGRVHGKHISIRFTNNAVPGPGSDITSMYVAVYAVR